MGKSREPTNNHEAFKYRASTTRPDATPQMIAQSRLPLKRVCGCMQIYYENNSEKLYFLANKYYNGQLFDVTVHL